MANKVTEDTIKKLIEQVLKEEQLNEKFNLTVKNDQKKRAAINKQLGLDDDSFKSTTGKTTFKDATKKWQSLANADKDDDLSDKDFKIAFDTEKTGTGSGRRKFADKVYKASSKQPSFKAYGGKYNPAGTTTADGDTDGTDDGTDDGTAATPLPGDLGIEYGLTDKSPAEDFKKAAKKAFKSISDNSTLQTATPAVNAISAALKAAFPKSQELKDIIKDFKDLQTLYAPLPTRDRGALGKSNVGITAADRKYTQMYSDPEFDVANVGQTTDDSGGDESTTDLRKDISGFTSVVDSSALAVADLFGGTAGTETELLSLTKNIRTVVEQIASIGDPKNDKTAGFTGAAAFKFAAQANFIFQLFNAGKMAEGTQAGYDFERFCGILFGGVVSGKTNGAVDVVTASKNGFLRMSQKFVDDKSQISQNWDRTKKVVITQNTPIYYMSLIKGGGSKAADYSKIDMYVIKLEKKNSQKMKSSYLDTSGNWQSAKATIGKSGTVVEIWHGAQPIPFDLGLSSLGTDPTAAAEKVANKIANSTSGDVQKIHQASTQIYQLSKNMLRNTEEYRAVKGGSKGGASTNPMDYLNQLSLDYDDLKTNYKDMFAVTGDAPTKTRSGMKGLTEQKITANSLKKLIEESFKK
jgi:hypothetical protein